MIENCGQEPCDCNESCGYHLREGRDEARDELETLRALIDGEPWAGAVLRRELDEARENIKALQTHVETMRGAWQSTSREVVRLMAELEKARSLPECVLELREEARCGNLPAYIGATSALAQKCLEWLAAAEMPTNETQERTNP